MLLNQKELADAYEELKETQELLASTHRYNEIARVGETPIDAEYHADEDTQKLKTPKEVEKIEGLPIDSDEKRNLLVTGAYNKDKGYIYKRLYDMSGEKPKFIAGGSIKLKDDLAVINGHLYQFSDNNNDLSYVTSHVHELLGKGFFTQYPGGFWNDEERHKHRDENTVCYCDNGEYKRLAIISPHLGDTIEVTPKGNLKFVDTWYNNNDASVDIYELNYDKKNSLIKTVFEDHYEETIDFSRSEEMTSDNASKTPQELVFEKNRKILEAKGNYAVEGEEEEYLHDEQFSSDLEVKVRPNIINLNGRQDGYLIDFRDGNGWTVAQVYTDTLRKRDKDFWYTYESGVLTVKDYNEGRLKYINTMRDDRGRISVSEEPMGINERRDGFKFLGWKHTDTKYGTFFNENYNGGTFVRKDGTEDKTFFVDGDCGVYTEVLSNGLASMKTVYYSNFGKKIEHSQIYDFKNSRNREDLDELKDLGDKFYAVRKTGEKQFGIYEMADDEMKNPLIMVDNCVALGSRDIHGWTSTNNLVYEKAGTTYRCEITSEGKLKPIAKQQSKKDLFLSSGGKWVKVDLKDNTRATISQNRIILEQGKYSVINGSETPIKINNAMYLSNDEAVKLARSIAKTAQKEKIDNKVLGSYHNAKERLQKHFEEKKREKDTKAHAKVQVSLTSNLKENGGR